MGSGVSFAKVYTSSCTVNQYQGPLDASDINQKVLRVALDVGNGGGSPACSGMAFNISGFGDVAAAKLYYTAQTNTFSITTLLDTKVPAFGSSITFSFPAQDNSSANGLWYYWLVLDMNSSITPGTVVDASYSTGTYTTTPTFITTDPSGFRMTGRNYTIGTGNNYTTVKAAADAIVQFDYDGATDIFMELTGNYASNAETAVITFTTHTGPAIITFRPATGQTGKITAFLAGSAVDFITFNGVQKIKFDGRAGGAGATQWTIRNLRTAATVGSVFTYINDASNNTLTYLKIEGDIAEETNTGLILFSTTTGTTGNDNNTISYCHIKDLAVADGGAARFPRNGIYCYGTAGKENSGNTIDNCQFYNIYETSSTAVPPFGTSPIKLNEAADSWIITNNHFYQTSSYTGLKAQYSFIAIDVGGGYTISNNYMGGTAINAGGSKFTVIDIAGGTTTGRFRGVIMNCTGTIIINGNTMTNIQYTSEYTGTLESFMGIALQGTATYTVGSVGNGNTIGSITTEGSITLTNNSSSGSLGFAGIYNVGSSASINIKNNNISGITVDGTRTDARTTMIYSSNGTAVIDSNNIGDINVQIGSASAVLNGIYVTTTGGDIKRNIIRNLVNTATTGTREINGIKLEGTTWNVHNNVVIIGSASSGNVPIYGIQDNNSSTINVYHNTVKVAGTAAELGSNNSAALLRTQPGADNVKNNIFQNERTNGGGGTGTHYSILASVTTGTFTENYDWYEAGSTSTATGLTVNNWGGGAGNNKTLATWRTATGGAANSTEENMTLDIEGGAGAAFGGIDAGEDLTATVPKDRVAITRVAPPWVGAYEVPSPLPVEIIYFTSQCEKEKILLHWATASEINNDYFEIQRTDGRWEDWNVVSTQKGAGNSSTIRKYEFMDTEIPSTSNPQPSPFFYYRLKQTDFDGHYKYSNIIAANCAHPEAQNVIIFPNPSDGNFSVLFQNEKVPESIKIFNVLGEQVYDQNVTGNNLISITLHQKLSPGIYMLTLSFKEGNTLQQKIVIR